MGPSCAATRSPRLEVVRRASLNRCQAPSFCFLIICKATVVFGLARLGIRCEKFGLQGRRLLGGGLMLRQNHRPILGMTHALPRFVRGHLARISDTWIARNSRTPSSRGFEKCGEFKHQEYQIVIEASPP